jgi:hypothetical protein
LASLAAIASAQTAPCQHAPAQGAASGAHAAYLGFDRNDYPGDAALPALRASFSFTGYWLNNPPSERANTWSGKRSVLLQQGFGFLLLFNGRLDKQLGKPAYAAVLGKSDATQAVSAALREGFPKGAVIFLDQEEGGRMLDEQNAYLFEWIDEVIANGFRAGVYCSGIPTADAPTTAEDIHEHAAKREIAFFVYNDVCPPSPGCARRAAAPPPSQSGTPLAAVWQFAQSPRRANYTGACKSTYAPDGNCYPQQNPAGSIFVDLDSALSPDPSGGK